MVSRLTSSYPSSKHLLSCTPPRKNEKKKHSQFWLLRSTAPREEEIAVASRLHPPWPIVDLKLRVFHSTKVEWTSSFSRHRLCFFCQICSTYVDGRVKEKIWTQDLFQTRFVMRMCVYYIFKLIESVWDCLRFQLAMISERFLLEDKLLWSLVFSFGLQSVHKTRFGNRCNRIEWVNGPDSVKLSTNGTLFRALIAHHQGCSAMIVILPIYIK